MQKMSGRILILSYFWVWKKKSKIVFCAPVEPHQKIYSHARQGCGRQLSFSCSWRSFILLDSDTFGSFPAQIEDSFRDNIGECTKCSCTGSHLQNFSYLSRLLSSTIRDWRVVQQSGGFTQSCKIHLRYHENLWDITDITNKIIYHQHLHSSTIRRIIYLQHSQLASACQLCPPPRASGKL